VVFLNFVLSLVIFVAVIAVGFSGTARLNSKAAVRSTGPQTYMVREGAGLNQIAAGLERQGIITNQRIFSIGAKACAGRRYAEGRRIRDQGRILDA
jgi:UPF0755 protein